MLKTIYSFAAVLLLVFLSACGGGGSSEFQKATLDTIIRDLPDKQPWSIILYDMNVDGTFFKEYQHRYKIITQNIEGNDTIPEETLTDWYEVPKSEFNANVDNMGMEIAHRDDKNELHKSVNPPGYGNYVGNTRYGHWVQRDGGSFWEFYGRYAFMSSMFNMMTYPVRRTYYDDYYTNYYRTGRSYYGPVTNGRAYYGTYSDYNRRQNTSSRWHSRSSNTRYAQRVNDRVSRSNSRYGSGSSRSRGGGFGK